MHAVQVSRSTGCFDIEGDPHEFDRQVGYGRILNEISPGSRMTMLILTGSVLPSRRSEGNVDFVPVPGRKLMKLRLVFALLSLHRSHRIDVITVQQVWPEGLLVLPVAWLMGSRTVAQFHFDPTSPVGVAENFGCGLLGRLWFRIALALTRRFDAVRVVAEQTRRDLKHLGIKVPIDVVSVPTAMYANQPPWRGAAQKVVLFVGRLAPPKNLEAWLQIAKRVHELEPAARFELVGEGALRAELEAKAASLGIADVTVFRGAIPYAELPRVYSEARCFLLTSHYEGFGRVVVEACWAGVPVVSTDIVGPREIIQDQVTGFLCPPGDIEQIASRIVALLRDPTLAEAIGVAARENVRQRFDPGVLAQRWMQLLVSAAKGEA